MKTVLIPTNFSENARNAAIYAISLFQDKDYQFVLLNVYSVPENYRSVELESLNDELHERSKHLLDQEMQAITTLFKNQKIRIRTRAESGSLISTIRFVQQLLDIACIVMGTSGAKGLDATILGSSTYDTIRENLPCPVIAIPGNTRFAPIQNILMVADFEKINRNLDLVPLIEIAQSSGSSVTVANVNHYDFAWDHYTAIKRLRNASYFSEINVNFITLTNDESEYDLDKKIESYIKNRQVDLLVMLARKNGFFYNFYNQNLTKKMTLSAPVPLLALCDKPSS